MSDKDAQLIWETFNEVRMPGEEEIPGHDDDDSVYDEIRLANFIEQYAKAGYESYKTDHMAGNEEEWNEEGEQNNYKEVMISNIIDILQDIELN